MASVAARAQMGESPFGRAFVVAFPDTAIAFTGTYINPLPDDARFVIFSNDTATVQIDAPGYHRVETVYPSQSRTVTLLDAPSPPPEPFLHTPDSATGAVFRITSDRDISLLCYYVTHDGCEAFQPMPVERWGTEYFAMALRDNFVFDVGFTGALEEQLFPAPAPVELAVFASEDSTIVTVSTSRDFTDQRDTTFLLNGGEAMLIETDPEAVFTFGWPERPRELTGTHITASKPIGVLSGNTRTDGGIGAQLISSPTTNSLKSGAMEWLRPTGRHGTTFVYRPIAPVDLPDTTQEIIRVVATSPGLTTVTPSNGAPPRVISQGGFAMFRTAHDGNAPGTDGYFRGPLVIRTDQPAEAMVITGSYVRLADPDISNEQVVGYAPSMSELVPREHWVNLARFNSFGFPGYLQHYAVIVADSGATVLLDSVNITPRFATIPGSPFMEARVEVGAGDHAIRSARGAFSAIAYGIGRGSEGYLPPATRKRDDPVILDDPGGAVPMPHPAKYYENLSVGYSYAVGGVSEELLPPDSLLLERSDACDSSLIIATRIGLPWTLGPLAVATDSGARNTDIAIDPIKRDGYTVGYRVRFRPIDPDSDAVANVTFSNASGRSWSAGFNYHARTFAAFPSPLEFLDATAGIERTLPLRLINVTTRTSAVLSLRLKNGGSGFSLRDSGGIGKEVAPGDSATATLAFTGSSKNTDYADTLIVETPCGSYEIPVHGHTGPAPVPTITGYDWGMRRIGSINDTLSFIGNTGSLGFTPASVAIVANPAGAFSLVAPDWHTIPMVDPGRRFPAGIRFAPAGPGLFTAQIVLITTDGDTARAELRGMAAAPGIGARDIDLGEICIRDSADTTLLLINAGAVPLLVGSVELRSDSIATLSPVGGGAPLPATIDSGKTLGFGVRLHPRARGPFADTVIIHSDAASGDSILVVHGTILSCTRAKLVVDDHDFGEVFITLKRSGWVTVRNLGGGDAMVNAMSIDGDAEGSFAITSPNAPFLVPDSDSVRVYCEFSPVTVGVKTARIAFATEVGPLASSLRGIGKIVEIPAFIRRDYHAEPGHQVTIRLELGGRLDTLPVSTLDIAIGFAPDLLDFLALTADSAGALGWRYFGARDADSIRARIDLAGRPPSGGSLLAMRMLTRFSEIENSELPFRVETGLPYVKVIPSPGLFHRDPTCGLELRMFDVAPNGFTLGDVVPNPLVGDGTIDFAIPFDDATTLIVYDALGREVLRPVDAVLKGGTYTTHIAAGALPAGLYYYRLTSGSFSAIRKLVVE
jgi:hypothetical protein